MFPKPTPFDQNHFRIPPQALAVAPPVNGAPTPHVATRGADAPTCNQHGPGDQQATGPGAQVRFDDAKRMQYCNLLHFGVTKGKAARIVGVSPRTVQHAVKRDPELAERIRQASLVSQSRAACQIAMAGEKSWRAAAWLLEQGRRRRGPGRPRKTPRLVSDPLARDEIKQLVRDVLLELMPELGRAILAPPAPIHPSPSVSPPLPQMHLPDVLENKKHPNAQQLPDAPAQHSPETDAPHHLTRNHTAVSTTVIAQYP